MLYKLDKVIVSGNLFIIVIVHRTLELDVHRI